MGARGTREGHACHGAHGAGAPAALSHGHALLLQLLSELHTTHLGERSCNKGEKGTKMMCELG